MAKDQPQAALVGTPQNPVPIGGKVGMLDLSRRFHKVHVRYAIWPSALRERHGTVCIFQGRTEFIEKYFEVVGELRRRGFAVATLDWRGQGGSTHLCFNRLKGHVRSFDDYSADIFKLMNEVVLPDCPPPYYVLGHSMGGAIALKAATMRGSWFDRMVLTGPMLGVEQLPVSPGLTGAVAKGLSLTGFSRVAVPGGMKMYRQTQHFDGNPLTSDAERFARNLSVIKTAPELEIGPPTFGWLSAAFKIMGELAHDDFPKQLRVPVLMVAAGNDAIVSNKAIERLAERLKIGDKIVLPGARHEILQEKDSIRQEFWAAFDAFIPGAKLKVAV
ncbi:alpha/beta hydrolase [Methyloligella sp. 2.7D]|uniref:alpha/beta fold hydrolase n=1 Tax=unclassified Methyloligella TaxID=2625955 RepID=UPI00157D539B|nr:alpha/beta hydrolase [Methyloligella sp. GL2]QKP76767.1 alpha/beta hydrolase [Methyloligella sp. GL2]